MVTARGWDGYGTTRIYFVYADDSLYAGQIGSVKSVYQLDQAEAEGYSRIYVVSRDSLDIPIRRA